MSEIIVSNNDMKGRYEQTMLMLTPLSHFGYTGYDHRVMHGTTVNTSASLTRTAARCSGG